jgi:hypothetical protein
MLHPKRLSVILRDVGGDKIKEADMGGACSTHWMDEKVVQSYERKT